MSSVFFFLSFFFLLIFVFFFYIFFSFSFFFHSFFSSFLFLLFLSNFSLCFLLFLLFIFFIFLFLPFTVNRRDEVLFRHDSRRSCSTERGAATPWQTDTKKHVWRLPELVDTMQHVVRVEQLTAVCQSLCSESLSSTSATTRMFTVLLSGLIPNTKESKQ